jgi:surface antigen
VVSEGYNERGEFCREFQKEIRVGGRIERGWGIACLQEDGSWRVTR